MIVIASAIAGAAIGALLGRRRGGNRADIAQHAAALTILGAILGLFATILISRLA